MPGRRKQTLQLTEPERVELDALASSRSLPHGIVRRAQMILWTEDGMPLAQAARRLKVSQPTVSFWRRRFRAQRLSGLNDEVRPGRRRTHDEDRIALLLNTAIARKPKAATHWTVRELAANTGIGQEHGAALPCSLSASRAIGIRSF